MPETDCLYLPRKTVSDVDLLLGLASTNLVFTDTIHPYYLSPAVCWLNEIHAQTKRFARQVDECANFISSVLLAVTLLTHVLRLRSVFEIGLVGTLWSAIICVTLLQGLSLTARPTVVQRNRHRRSAVHRDLASFLQKHATFMFLLTSYVYTWLYYNFCKADPSAASCLNEEGPPAVPTMKWTIFVFIWINTVGLFKLCRRRVDQRCGRFF